MPVTKVGCIYSLNQNVRRSIVASDVDDTHIDGHKGDMLPGEGWLDIPLEVYLSFNHPDQLDAYIATIIGEAQDDTCVVVSPDTGEIVASIPADPRIDYHPDGFIIQDDTAVVGGTYDFETQMMVTPP